MATALLPQVSKPHLQVQSESEIEAKPGEQEYFLSQNPTELERLSYQHEIIKDYMGSNLVLAPIDLSRPGLHIFDSATADGPSPPHTLPPHNPITPHH